MVEIPEFDGVSLNPEDYIERKNTIDRYFEYKETPTDQSCIMVSSNQVCCYLVRSLEKEKRGKK